MSASVFCMMLGASRSSETSRNLIGKAGDEGGGRIDRLRGGTDFPLPRRLMDESFRKRKKKIRV